MNTQPAPKQTIGLAADHAGFALKQKLSGKLAENGYEITDFGNFKLQPDDDYPDFIIPLAQAIAAGKIFKGIAICGSGVGACIVSNKISGVRAALIHDTFSARQGVNDDALNLLCLGELIIGEALAWDVVTKFLAATFSGEERHVRRLRKITALETNGRWE
jgi:ribose 5-phosphate isomerase B